MKHSRDALAGSSRGTGGEAMVRRLLTVCVVVALSCSAFGFLSMGQSTRPLIIGIEGPLMSMDPMSKAVIRVIGTLRNIYDGFFSRSPDGTLGPGLVESFERLDQLTWRFYVRQGISFHNGNPLTADDLKYTLDRTGTSEQSQYKDVGAQILSTTVVDQYTLDVVTKSPNPVFPSAIYSLGVMDKEWGESHDDAYIATHAMGTGPYRFVSWINEDLTLEANDAYWQGVPSIKRVVYRPIADDATRMAALQSGEVDLITLLPLDSIEAAQRDSRLTLVAGAAELVYFLTLRQSDPAFPTAQLKVRQAIYSALDIDEIIDTIFGGLALPASQMVASAAYPGYDSELERVLPFDLNKARQLLAEAGYADGFSITLDGSNDTSPNDDELAVAIAAQLSRIEIDVQVNAVPGSIAFPLLLNGESDFFLMSWREQAFDLSEDFVAHIANVPERGWGFFNGGGYNSLAVNTLMLDASSVVSLDDRAALLRGANKLAMYDIATIPVLITRDLYGATADLLNFSPRADQFMLAFEMSYK
jgi:peptide/nickel transport system substrate-binding protein